MSRVIFDGKIANRNEICEINNIIQTITDEELIAVLYERKGIGFVDDLDGQYAIVISNGNQIFLIRDKLGFRSLYFTVQNEKVYYEFCLKSLVAELPQKPRIDCNAIYQYLSFWALPSDVTWFEGVKKVEPGTYIVIEDRKIQKCNYYNISDIINDPIDDNDQVIHSKVERVLTNYLKAKKENYYLPLSGGVDSCLLAAIGGKTRNKMYFISVYVNNDDNNDEIARIRNMKDFFYPMCMEFKSCRITSQTVSDTVRLISQQICEPMQLMDMMLIMTIMEGKEGLYILGEGADELGGYTEYVDANEINNILQLRKKSVFCDRYYKGNYVTTKHIVGMSEGEKKNVWKKGQCANSYEYISTLYEQINNNLQDAFLRKIQNVDFKFRLPEYLLKRTGVICNIMHTEADFPFLSRALVEYCLRINKDRMVREGKVKRVFRNILNKYVPAELWEGKKIGLGDGLDKYINDIVLENYIKEIESKENHPLFRYLDREKIGEMVRDNNRIVWSIYSLGVWIEQFSFDVQSDEGVI